MINSIRRTNLSALVDERFEGNRAAFCRATGKNPNLINLILTKNPELQRGIGEKLCRDIEAKLDLPTGWLDQRSPSNNDRSVSVPVITSGAAAASDEWIVLLPETLRRLTPNVGHSYLACVKVAADHMSPTIASGDFVLIDKSVDAIDASGSVFALDTGGEIVFARFRKSITSQWSISYDNTNYPPAAVEQSFIDSQKVVGRAIVNLHAKSL